MHDYYTDPDARSGLVPLLTGIAIGACTGLVAGLFIGVKWALGVGG